MEQLVLYEGRPADCTGRLEKEVRTYDFLDKLGIHYWRTDHAWMKADTMEDCHVIDACLNAAVCKNLFLCNRQKTNFYLLMMPGNKPLKTILTQCAKSARSVKGSYFSAQYQRIAARRGKNRATLAVAHSMLIAIYHMLRNNVPFRDLGSDYYDSFNRDRKIHGYLKRLKALGWEPDALPGSA